LLSAFFPFPALQFLTSCLGLLLIHTMAGVYRLRSMAVWNTWRTFVAFLLSAFLLGFYLTAVTLWLEAGNPDIEFLRLLPGGVHFVALLLLLGECYIATQGKFFGSVLRLRIGIILGTSLFLACGLIFPVLPGLYFFSLIFLLILTEEILGRWLFYSELDRRIL